MDSRFFFGLLVGFALALLIFMLAWGFGGIRRSAPIKRRVPPRRSVLSDMIKVRFTGRIYPLAMSVSITDFPTIVWSDGDMVGAGLSPTCHVQVQNNEVTIDIDLQYFQPGLLTPLAMRAYDTVRVAVDLLSFTSGNGFTFLLETWTNPEGETRPLMAQQPGFAELSTAVAAPGDFSAVLHGLIADWPMFLALRDLIDGITQWHQAPITVARSVERLRHSVLPNEKARKKQWEKLCELLQISDSYLKIIRETSIGPRHGDPTHIPAPVTNEVATRSWIIMNRYLEFRKRGAVQPLPISEFPLLT
jgi:hypothetical protein